MTGGHTLTSNTLNTCSREAYAARKRFNYNTPGVFHSLWGKQDNKQGVFTFHASIWRHCWWTSSPMHSINGICKIHSDLIQTDKWAFSSHPSAHSMLELPYLLPIFQMPLLFSVYSRKHCSFGLYPWLRHTEVNVTIHLAPRGPGWTVIATTLSSLCLSH